MDKYCVMKWLNEVYVTPSRAFNEYTDDELKMFAHDALILLKEQESKPDKCIICEGCGHKLQDDWNWCPWCRLETVRGRRVKVE